MGADLAYIGSAFIATTEATPQDAYKQMIVDERRRSDIVYTNLFTGVHGNYLRGTISRAGMDPDNLATSDPSAMNLGDDKSEPGGTAKAWRDIWGAGQGIAVIDQIAPTARVVERLADEYAAARKRLSL